MTQQQVDHSSPAKRTLGVQDEPVVAMATNQGDPLLGGAGNDILTGGDDSDVMRGDDGDDTLIGGAGVDYLYGGAGNDTYVLNWNSSYDTLFDSGVAGQQNVLQFGQGISPAHIRLERRGLDLIVHYERSKSANGVTVQGFYADMNDRIGNGAINAMVFDNGERHTLVDFGLDALDPVIKGTAGDDLLSGESIGDTIEGYAGNDSIYGNPGNDILIGDLGNDTLNGGADRDTLIGGLGNDTYELGAGSGHDTVIEPGAEGEQNVLQFAQGIHPDQIKLERVGNHLVVHYDQSKVASSVTLQDYYASAQDSVGKGYISELVFDTGRYTLGDFDLEAPSTVIAGTDGNDVLLGSILNDTLEGHAGNDTLVGKAGNDTLIGGLGDDTYELYSGSGHDTVIESGVAGEQNILKFGPGTHPAHLRLERVGNSLVVHYDQSKVANSVTLQDYYTGADDSTGKAYISALVFESGERYTLADFLPQAPVLTGTIGDVVVDTNNVNEGQSFSWFVPAGLFTTAPGSYLNYSFALADGSPLPAWLTYDPHQGRLLGNPYDVQVGDLAIVVTATNSAGLSTQTSFQLQGRDINDAPTASTNPITLTGFANEPLYMGYSGFVQDRDEGDVLTYSATLADGSPLPAWLRFTQNDASSFSFSGTPAVESMGMLEILLTATDQHGASVQKPVQLEVMGVRTPIIGTEGHDELSGTQYGDTLQGNAGNDVLSGLGGFDILTGDAGDDTLIGGEGYDHLHGGEGSDTYVLNWDSSHDTLIDTGVSGQQNILQFGQGISPAHIRLERRGLDLVVHYEQSKSANSVTVQGFYTDMNDRVGNGTISALAFENGQRLTLADFGLNELDPVIKGTAGHDWLHGSVNDDTIEGYAGNDRLFGNAGNDVLLGGLGDDTLDGNGGYDTLIGGLGNDTYELVGWSGQDTVIESGAEGEQNILQFTQGVNPDQIRLERVGNHLVVHYDQSKAANSVTLQDYYTSAQDSVGKGYISELVFDTGRYTLSHFGLEALSTAIAGTDGNDVLSGFNANDTLEGHAGNDTLVGKAGNDTLIGGLGDDTYELYSGSGHDTVIESGVAGEQNILKFGPGTHPAHLRLERVGNSLVVHYDQSKVANSVTLQDYYTGADDSTGKAYISELVFASGERYTLADFLPQAPVLTGTIADVMVDTNNVNEGQSFSWVVPEGLFTTAPGSALSYSFALADGSPLPSWLTYDPRQGRLLGNPYDMQVGDLAIVVTATNSVGLSTQTSFQLQGRDINDAPTPIADTLVLTGFANEFLSMGYGGFFQDRDEGDVLTYSATLTDGSPLPAWLSFTQTDASTFFISGTPAVESVGMLEFLLTATDQHGASVQKPVQLEVMGVRTPIIGTEGNDELSGTHYGDTLQGNAGDDTLIGGEGYDQLHGGEGSDTYVLNWDSSYDTLIDTGVSGQQNILQFGQGISPAHIRLERRGQHLIVHYEHSGLANAVTVLGFYADMDDRIGNGAISALVFDKGERHTLADFGLDALDPMFKGTAGDDRLVGEGTDDTMEGYAGNDSLYGNPGNDILIGNFGNDMLDGGMDRDTLIGGLGSDTYELGGWSGHDTVIESGAEGEQNILQFAQGIRPDQIRLERVGNNLVVHFDQSKAANSVTLQDYYSGADDSAGKALISELVFASGERNKLADFFPKAPVLNGIIADVVVDTNNVNAAQSFSWVVPEGLFTAAPGSALRYSFSLADGSPLPSWLTYDPQQGRLLGNPYDVQVGDLAIIVTVNNGFGLSTQTSFQLQGREINDTPTLFILPSVPAFFAGEFSSYGPGCAFDIDVGDMITYTATLADGSPLPSWLNFGQSDPKGTTGFQLSGVPTGDFVGMLDILVTATDTQGASVQQLMQVEVTGVRTPIVGTEGNDDLSGTRHGDTLQGHAGNDKLSGLSERDTLIGGAGDDTLIGGDSDDHLDGGEGNDTYLFNKGFSRDTLIDSGAAGQQNVLQFGEGISPAHIRLERKGLDLIVHFEQSKSADAITVQGFYAEMHDLVGNGAISQLVFENGERYTLADFGLNALDPVIKGTAGDDQLSGENIADKIEGYAGNDSLYGNYGNDILIGDLGNDMLNGGADRDTLMGGLGNDTYELAGWSGHDTVIESGAEGEQNILQFAQGVNPDQIRLERVGNHLVVHYDQSKAANSVTLQDYYTSAQDSVGKGYISELVFDTGRYTLSHFGLEALSTAIAGTDGNDVLSGFNANDTLEGHAGNDTLVGKAGNDTLIGGLGDDTYELYSGSGHDTVIESGVAGEQNILKFGPGTHPAHLRLERVGNSLVVHYDQSKVANSVTLQDYYHGVEDKIGKGLIGAVQFDGTGETIAFSHFLSQLNQAPVVAGGVVDQLATAESPFSWQLPAGLFADADGDKLAYTVSQADGSALPVWLKFDATTGLLSGTPVNSQAGVLALRVTATDPGNLSTHLDFALQVRAINHAPEAVGTLEKQTMRVGQPFEFYLPEGIFRDVDSESGDSLTLSFTLADGSPLPAWLSFDAATRKLSGTPGAASVGDLQLVVVAQDTAGASAKLGLGLTVAVPAGTVLTGGTGADNLQGTAGADSLSGMAGNDKLYGNDGNDTLRGDAGNDLLDGGEGDNLLDGGDGNDKLYGGSGHETLLGGAGNDQLYGWSGNDKLDGGLGNDTLTGDEGHDLLQGGAGRDELFGGVGNDTLASGAGADWLEGGQGDDTYRFLRGDGFDVITELAGEGSDTIHFGEGIAVNQLKVGRSGNDLEVRLAGSGDGMTVRGWFAAEGNRVEQFLFDDGQVLTASQLEALLPATKQSARIQAQPVESFGPIALPAAGVDGREFQRPAPLHDMELVGRSDAGIAQQVSSLVDAMASFAPSSMGNLAAGMSTQDIYTPLLTKPQQ